MIIPVRRFLLIFTVANLLSSSIIAEDFYEQQLAAGKTDFQANRLVQAANELRIAAFGFLDRPSKLSESLVRLAVAQSALGQTAEVSRTLDRFVEVEQRFAPYSTVRLETPIQLAFEELVTKTVPRSTLQSLPGLASVANYELRKILALPAPQRIRALEAQAQREPKNPEWPLSLAREYAARDSSKDVVRWATRVLEVDPKNKEASFLAAHARTARRECREALAVLDELSPADFQERPEVFADQTVCYAEMSRWNDAQRALASVPEKLKSRPDVRRAAELIAATSAVTGSEAKRTGAANQGEATKTPSGPRLASIAPISTETSAELLDMSRRLIRDGKYQEALARLGQRVRVDPKNRSLHLALLEAGVLAKDWRTAVAHLQTVAPLLSGEELYMFYASVALYESGRRGEAAEYMRKARPFIVSNPMVEHYIKAVLGGNQ